MSETLRTKAELLALMTDNVSGDITPQDLRDFVVSNLVRETEITSSDGIIGDQVDRVIAGPGTNTLALPDAFDYGNRQLELINASAGDVIFTGTIGLATQITLTDEQFAVLMAIPAENRWVTLVNTSALGDFIDLEDTPIEYAGQLGKHLVVNVAEDALEFSAMLPRLYQIFCGGKDPDTGDYLEWINQQNSDEAGYCVIRDGTIVAASINRTDNDDAIIEIRTPSGDTVLFTNNNQTVFDPLSISVAAGDRIRARNTGPNKVSNIVLSLLIEED